MKLAIIGASGFVGRALVKYAISRKYEVLAISRSGKFDLNPLITSIHCDIFEEEQLKKAVSSADIVISSFHPGWNHPNQYHAYIQGYQHIINVVKSLDKRLILVGGTAGLMTHDGTLLYEQMSTDLKQKVRSAIDLYEKIKHDFNLKWTFISPAQEILPFETPEKYNVGGDYLLYNSKGKSQINVIDLARFMIDQAVHAKNIHKRLTVCNI